VRVVIDRTTIQVRLSRWEKVLGLIGDITVPLEDVSDVRVVEEPLRETMSSGLKVGLRLPWLLYIARTIRLDHAFLVRRGMPGLSFGVANHGALQRVLVSTPDARELAGRLDAPASSPAGQPQSTAMRT
jgi:hypothetical protein